MLPCARAVRRRTPKEISRPLVQSPVLPWSLRLLCATSVLPSPGHASEQAPKWQAPHPQVRRHLTTNSHVCRLSLKDDEVIEPRAKHTGSLTPVLPTSLMVQASTARRRNFRAGTP
ncbi:hypothetical protein MTO96_001863 [Rhipicephalus appendiculatus]